jgi:hypothetical protein
MYFDINRKKSVFASLYAVWERSKQVVFKFRQKKQKGKIVIFFLNHRMKAANSKYEANTPKRCDVKKFIARWPGC